FAEAARMAVSVKGPIVGKGEVVHPWRAQHGAEWMAKRYLRFSNTATGTGMSFGAAGAEVDVDKETGLVEMRRLAHAYDVGFALNPLGVEEQLQGGAGMAAGFALSEEVLYDNGQVLNPGYSTYNMLTALDMPNTIPIIVERNDPTEGPYGAKELGMGASCAPGSAVASAIYDATGVMLKEYPATPERILKALEGI
ncbi:MAG TPA: molybdopterin cofactor-binding domain-containing protein, partial [Dehalococcoidia bacterium]|nr:molybdopterin cofactor-binding domain-containing protein [Dehalococcoidia bacterium]